MNQETNANAKTASVNEEENIRELSDEELESVAGGIATPATAPPPPPGAPPMGGASGAPMGGMASPPNKRSPR